MAKYINVLDEYKSIELIQKFKVGIARFGDGEFKLAIGHKIKSQAADPLLKSRLLEILRGDPTNNTKVGLPNMYNGIKAIPGTKAHGFWTNMVRRKEYYDLVNTEYTYLSSFITRPDNAPSIDTLEYYTLCKGLWEGRNVVLVHGQDIAFCKQPSLLENCNVIGEVVGPAENAWADYTRILYECAAYPTDTLFLIRLGPTATVLAWDLGRIQMQALDLGHLGMFYNRLINREKSNVSPE